METPWGTWLYDNHDRIYGRVVIIDTNIFMSNFDILDLFTSDTVLIPDVVLDELEYLHKNKNLKDARSAISVIHNKLTREVQNILIVPVGKYRNYVDDILLDGAIVTKEMFPVLFVTGDKNLHLKATGYNIEVQYIQVKPKETSKKYRHLTGKQKFYVIIALLLVFSVWKNNYEDSTSFLFSLISILIAYLFLVPILNSFKIKEQLRNAKNADLNFRTILDICIKGILLPTHYMQKINVKLINTLDRFLPVFLVTILIFFSWWIALSFIIMSASEIASLFGLYVNPRDSMNTSMIVAVLITFKARIW